MFDSNPSFAASLIKSGNSYSVSSRILRLAVTRFIQIVDEAARRVPEDFKLSHPSIPWKEAISMRNILVHDYLSIDDRIIWRTVTNELPTLAQALHHFGSEMVVISKVIRFRFKMMSLF